MSDILRGAAIAAVLSLCALCGGHALAQSNDGSGAAPSPDPTYTPAPAAARGPDPAPGAAPVYNSNELIDAGHRLFGNVSEGLASVVEHAVSKYGLPNGYILGQEGAGAVVGGVRYGEGMLYTRNAGQHKVYWQGPSIGLDVGANGDRMMMLVYNLPSTDARLPALSGRQRLGLCRGRLRHDRARQGRHLCGSDRLRGRRATRRELRLPEVYRPSDLEPLLGPFAAGFRGPAVKLCPWQSLSV